MNKTKLLALVSIGFFASAACAITRPARHSEQSEQDRQATTAGNNAGTQAQAQPQPKAEEQKTTEKK